MVPAVPALLPLSNNVIIRLLIVGLRVFVRDHSLHLLHTLHYAILSTNPTTYGRFSGQPTSRSSLRHSSPEMTALSTCVAPRAEWFSSRRRSSHGSSCP